MLTSLFESLEMTPVALFVAESSWAFPTIESLHVLFIVLVVGSIAVVDLRLLGLASVNRSVTNVSADVLPITWISFGLAAVTGLLIFCSRATDYAENWPFRIIAPPSGKKILVVGAGPAYSVSDTANVTFVMFALARQSRTLITRS